jgi:hypothetical protein
MGSGQGWVGAGMRTTDRRDTERYEAGGGERAVGRDEPAARLRGRVGESALGAVPTPRRVCGHRIISNAVRANEHDSTAAAKPDGTTPTALQPAKPPNRPHQPPKTRSKKR